MWVGPVPWDLPRRPFVAGRPCDVRTHVGFRFAVCPLSGVGEAILRIARVYYIRENFGKCPPRCPKNSPTNPHFANAEAGGPSTGVRRTPSTAQFAHARAATKTNRPSIYSGRQLEKMENPHAQARGPRRTLGVQGAPRAEPDQNGEPQNHHNRRELFALRGTTDTADGVN
jgi:hypothetical protein